MAQLFLGIDLGTSATKALLIDAKGRVRGSGVASHATQTPQAGWSQQRPSDWWRSAGRAIRMALAQARVAGDAVASVGLSGQMHGSVFLDRERRVVAPAILWNDQRTTAECKEIERRAGGRAGLIRMTRNVALTGYTAPKVLWLRKQRPTEFRRVRWIVLPKDYLRLRLTDSIGTDVSDASGTLLFDVARRRWSLELLRKLDLDPALFPHAAESCEIVGGITATAARATGLRAGTPVAAGAGDQPAAAVGLGIVRSGRVSATIGTSGVVFAHGDTPAANQAGLLQSFCHAVPGKWCVFGCMLAAGGSLQWAREVLYADRLAAARTAAARDAIYEQMIRDAAAAGFARSRSSHGGLVFHPYLSGERCPYPHPHARGGWIGVERGHSRGALVRAVLEGVTIGMRAQIELIRAAGTSIREVRLAGGGARSEWWRQLQADAYGAPCTVLQTQEGSAFGAALLGAVGCGAFASVAGACDATLKVGRRYTPNPARTRQMAALAAQSSAVYAALEPIYRSGG